MQFTFGDKGEDHLLDESVLTVTRKEKWREGKSSISPRMKYGHPNPERLNTLHLPFEYGQTMGKTIMWTSRSIALLVQCYVVVP